MSDATSPRVDQDELILLSERDTARILNLFADPPKPTASLLIAMQSYSERTSATDYRDMMTNTPKPANDDAMRAAHAKSIWHRASIEASRMCGCFYCQHVFPPSEIVRWIDNGDTALCPRCSVDSVLGDFDVADALSPVFLKAMHDYWLEGPE